MESQLLTEEQEVNDSKSRETAEPVLHLRNLIIWAIRYHQILISVLCICNHWRNCNQAFKTKLFFLYECSKIKTKNKTTNKKNPQNPKNPKHQLAESHPPHWDVFSHVGRFTTPFIPQPFSLLSSSAPLCPLGTALVLPWPICFPEPSVTLV